MQFRKWLESTNKMFLEGRRKLDLPDFHPEHVTKFNIINPKFLTSSVVALAKEAAGESFENKQNRIWVKPASRSSRWFHPAQRKEGRPLLPKEYRDLIEKKKKKD